MDFDVTLSLDENSTATVTEEITVNAEHNKIRRGIYRTIPQDFMRKIQVKSLEMDYKPHPFFIENRGKDIIINFGDDDYIPRGQHTYKLTYTMSNAVNSVKYFDEIYWNVTGNYWNFPIQKATFRLNLPKGTQIIEDKISLYTGAYGQKGTNARQKDSLIFETTYPLSPKEGFTVAVPFKKGLIHKDTLYRLIEVLPFIAVLLIFLYYYLTWRKYGKDPDEDVPPLYKPPKGISPAVMRYIWFRYTDSTMFAATLVSLAMKQNISIEYSKSFLSGSSAEITVNRRNEENLSEDEKFVMRHILLFKHFQIEKSNANAVQNALKSYCTEIKSDCEKYIRRNYALLIVPVIILMLLLVFLGYNNEDIFTVFLIRYTIIVMGFCFAAKKMFYKVLIFAVITALLVFMIYPFTTTADISFFYILAYLILLFGLIIFAALIDNVSKEYTEVYLQIKGFRKYMTTAEKYRALYSNPTENTKIFCDYLPYAYALGIQNKWINAFKDIIDANTIETNLNRCGGMNFMSSALLTKTINSSIPSKGGRGGFGSGGGGFSGGGFGGGGGGGR